MKKTAYIIDAFAQIFRAFYAGPLMNNSKGEYTNAVFGFARFLLYMEKEYNPEYGAVVFDKGKPAERIKILPEYKANRKPMPEELRVQLDYIRELTAAFGYPLIEEEDKEADDVIAGLAAYFKDYEIYIISADKDIAQVIDERVKMLIPGTPKKGLVLRGVNDVIEKFSVSPGQIIDYLAMLGDASDNIPGLQGVGKITAAKLLNEYSSIENMINNPDSISNKKIREKIIQNRELLKKNIQLITLSTDLDEKHRSGTVILKKTPEWNSILEIAEKLELKSFIKAVNSYLKENEILLTEKNNQLKSDSEKHDRSIEKMYTPDMFE